MDPACKGSKKGCYFDKDGKGSDEKEILDAFHVNADGFGQFLFCV